MCNQWADEFAGEEAAGRVSSDPGLVREGIGLFRHLAASAEREVLLCTDLHAENVLAAKREPWLIIDPKPYVGDPTYDALQHMLNCEERLSSDPRGFASRTQIGSCSGYLPVAFRSHRVLNSSRMWRNGLRHEPGRRPGLRDTAGLHAERCGSIVGPPAVGARRRDRRPSTTPACN
jgi:hypothetical protein